MEHRGKINPTKSDLSARIFIVGYPPVELKGKCMLCLIFKPRYKLSKKYFFNKGHKRLLCPFFKSRYKLSKKRFFNKGHKCLLCPFSNPYTSDFERKGIIGKYALLSN